MNPRYKIEISELEYLQNSSDAALASLVRYRMEAALRAAKRDRELTNGGQSLLDSPSHLGDRDAQGKARNPQDYF
jgi:hypothetical protein